MQFAVTAMKAGKKAAVYMFDEVLDTLFERAEKLCLGKEGGLRAFIAEGLLHAQQVDPAEMSPGAFAHEVRRAVEAGAKVIIIDSLNGYLNAMPEERFLTTHLHEMFAYLNQKGVVTIMVVAQHGMIVGGGMAGDVDVSYLADTVLLFRYFEARGEILQAVSVFKKRTGEHERTLRELQISAQGRGGRRAAAGVPRDHDRRAAVRREDGDAPRQAPAGGGTELVTPTARPDGRPRPRPDADRQGRRSGCATPWPGRGSTAPSARTWTNSAGRSPRARAWRC